MTSLSVNLTQSALKSFTILKRSYFQAYLSGIQIRACSRSEDSSNKMGDICSFAIDYGSVCSLVMKVDNVETRLH